MAPRPARDTLRGVFHPVGGPDIAAELARRYEAGLHDVRPWLVGAAVGAVVTGALLLARRPRRVPPWLAWALALPMAIGAVVWAWKLLWVADDAFFAFRYAHELAHGYGLVFNPGERVEGYTDFLWTVLIAGAIRAGLSPLWASVITSLACFASVVVMTARLAAQSSPWKMPVLVSVAALVTAANYVMACYGTSGLETMLGALLVLVAVERASRGHLLAAGCAGIAATLAHPDHSVFYASLGLALLTQRPWSRRLLWYGAPFALVFVPYYLWRWHYYGDFFPNTYYAKSGGQEYFPQGWTYVSVSLVAAGALGALPVALYGAWRLRRRLIARYFMISTPIYLVYVAKIGGDFMLGRLLVPVLPVLFVLAECGLRELFASPRVMPRLVGVPALLLVFVAAVPVHVIKPFEKKWYIADERTFYEMARDPLRPRSGYYHWAEDIQRYVIARGVRPRVAFGSAGMLAYYTDLFTIDTFGLTDRVVAHTPIVRRARPGHEKSAAAAYLVQSGVDMTENTTYPAPYDKLTQLHVGRETFHIPVFHNDILDPLRRKRGVAFLDIKAYLDRYRAAPDPARRACDVWFLDQYYLSVNHDRERLAALRETLVAADSSLAGLRPLLVETDAAPAGFKQVAALHFDAGERWTRTGAAFFPFPAMGAVPGQSMVLGAIGPFASSMMPGTRDAATGDLVSAPFTIQGDAITLRVGGGMDLRRLSVSLVVDAQPVRVATGCASEMLGQRVWSTSELRGKTATVAVHDASRGGWGHVTADEIVQWARTTR